MDPAQYTNDVELWHELGLDRTGDVLWKLFHQQRYSIDKHLVGLDGWKKANRIFLWDHEGLSTSFDCLKKDSRVHLWDSTFYDHPRFHTNLRWLNWMRNIEENMKLGDRLISAAEKKTTHVFDALLGSLWPNKKYMLDRIKSHQDPNSFLLGNLSSLDLSSQLVPKNFILGGDFETHINKKIAYQDQCVAQSSCFVPYAIYNRTWYSLICETYRPEYAMVTEKIGKALLGKRIFILVSSQHGLKNLKKIGFKTFSPVIDESYDDIADDEKRWQAAWNSIESLLDLDPANVYEVCQEILEHNRNLVLNTDWNRIFKKEVMQILTLNT